VLDRDHHESRRYQTVQEETQRTSDVEFMTVDQVAEMLHLSRRTIQDYCWKGLIPYIKIGKIVRFNKDEIVNYMMKYRVEPIYITKRRNKPIE